jgi:hypothetical protein
MLHLEHINDMIELRIQVEYPDIDTEGYAF